MVKLSLIIHTASRDKFLSSQGLNSYFDSLTWTLKEQTFQDFELIYVDTYYEENLRRFGMISGALPYPVKHVPLHPEHRYWFDKGYCYISAAKNTGILYADGELCVSCDDAEFLPAHLLAEYWKQYRGEGRYLHALHKRLRSIVPDSSDQTAVPRMPIEGDVYQNDHRWQYVESGKPYGHRYGNLCFAGTSFSLGDALTINGFNERMDGCKSLEDCDFGNRLQMLGRSFVMVPEGYLYILEHGSAVHDPASSQWPEDREDRPTEPAPEVTTRKLANFIAVENYGLYRCGTELLDIVANKNPLTHAHYRIIQEATLQYRKFDPLAPENAEKLAIWQGTPTFNLNQQRNELRNSPNWKWS